MDAADREEMDAEKLKTARFAMRQAADNLRAASVLLEDSITLAHLARRAHRLEQATLRALTKYSDPRLP